MSPTYGMDGNDIYYPSWFAGTWNVRSVCTQVMAPCDILLFGGETKYQEAQKQIGKPILYQSRFLLLLGNEYSEYNNNDTIADREFNVKSIAKATMGNASVVDVVTSTPNRLSVLLAIGGGTGTTESQGGLIQADLLTLNRRQERGVDNNNDHFDCAEAVQEIVTLLPSTNAKPKLLKLIETASLYRRQKDGSILCRQRSATFLLPSQQDPIAMKLWQITAGRPVDVRFYDVAYAKSAPSV